MASATKALHASKFRLLQETASRLSSVASTAPGSTRTGQGTAAPKKWMKLDAQGMIPEAHPSAILVREKALVIHLESIRMVITQEAVYILTVPSAMDRQVGVLPTSDAPLVKDLMLRLSMASEASNKSPATRAERAAHVDVALPYELRALEGALHVAVAALEADTLQLEQCIGTSLDNLDRRISRRELENIQQGKSRITRLHAKLSRLTQVLEGILDDDADMADMYLARRAQLAATSATSATQQRADWDTAPNEHQKSEAKTTVDTSAMPKGDIGMQNEGQQEPTRPSFLDSKRLSQVRRRRSSTNGYDAISCRSLPVRAEVLLGYSYVR
ncbi:hypothetical protein ABBQ32_000147 [Trebouxia sp. C0010 RCD-2024]